MEDHDAAKSGCALVINLLGSFSGTLGIGRALAERKGDGIFVLVTPVYLINGAWEHVSWFEEKEAQVPTPSKRTSERPFLLLRKIDSSSDVPIVESTACMFIHQVQDLAKPCRNWFSSQNSPGHIHMRIMSGCRAAETVPGSFLILIDKNRSCCAATQNNSRIVPASTSNFTIHYSQSNSQYYGFFIRTVALHEWHAPTTRLGGCAVNGRLIAQHQLWVRGPPQYHGTIHSEVRRIY